MHGAGGRMLMLVVTPNLCFDSTIHLVELVPGTVSRATSTELSAGGKGVNVMRALRPEVRSDAQLLGFLPAADGQRLAELLALESVGFVAVPVEGAVRVCTIVLEADGRTSVINGPGPHIADADWASLRRSVSGRMRAGDVVTCDGSLPPGAPDDGYAQIVEDAHRAGSLVIVDAAPAQLGAALPAGPDLVCPNLAEAEGLLDGRRGEQVDETAADVVARAVRAARNLHRRGARRAVVTAGSRGAALVTDDGAWWLTAPHVTVASTIGAGDSFVAGTATELARGRPDVDAVRCGIATASASCEQIRAGGVDHARAEDLMKQIRVERLSSPAGRRVPAEAER